MPSLGWRVLVRPVLALTGGLAIALNSACYSYLPPPGAKLSAGTDVRMELTADGSTSLQGVLGPRIQQVEGRLQSVDADGIATVAVDQVSSFEGVSVSYTGREPVRIPRTAVARTDVRTLDRKRSWMAGGVVGGIFLVAVITALAKAKSRASGAPGKLGGSPPDLRAP